MGHAADLALITVGVITAIVILCRDRRVTRQTVASGLLLALMIVFSGHDDLLIETALILVAVTLAQAVRGGPPLAPENRERQPAPPSDSSSRSQ
jgi:hypothetical protein